MVNARVAIARALADIRDQSEADDEEEIRPVGVWLALASNNVVEVHIGDYLIAELTDPEAGPARAAIQQWGQGTRKVLADGDLLGETPDNAHLDLWIQAPRP